MGYLQKVADNVKEEIQYCSCGTYLGQTGDPSFSGGKRVVVEEGSCQECKDRAAEREREVLEAQQIMGRLGVKQ